MTIEEIMEMWGEDSHIEDTDLDNESLKIPNLHQKYLDIYSKEKRKMSDLDTHWKVLFSNDGKWLFPKMEKHQNTIYVYLKQSWNDIMLQQMMFFKRPKKL